MKKYDFFISHSSADSKIVEQIMQELEKNGAKCWYAPRDIQAGMPYSKAIVQGINESKILLLCLSKASAISDQVNNEIEMAYKRFKNDEDRIILQPLFIEDFDIDKEEYDALTYYIKRFNYIIPKEDKTANGIVSEIIKNNKDIFKPAIDEKENEEKKIVSTYFVDEKEAERLALQSKIGLKFDGEIYKNIFSKYENPTILDLGCGNGNQIFDRLEYAGQKNFKLIGLEYDEKQVERAKKKFDGLNASFYLFDVESNTFVDDLTKINKENEIEKYDVINMCLLLKHLKHPAKIFTKVRRFLKDDGILIIREYENCICYAVPDEKGYMRKCLNLLENDNYAGYGHIGREIYGMLYDANFKNIDITGFGKSTIGFTPDEKESVFNSEFAYLSEDLALLVNDYPNDKKRKDDYDWFMEHKEEIYEDFMKPNFVFMSGKILYTAQK